MYLQYLDENKSTNQPLSTNLFNELQIDILSGKLKTGDKLTEKRICDEYKVSRTPVREALRQLEMDGLIENIPNKGAFVLGLSPQDIEDMHILRKVYEVQAVKWAIERITEDEMRQLEETFEFMEFYTMKNDINKMLNINTGFHQIIYNASHNRMLQQLLCSYQVYLKYSAETNYFAPDYLSTVLGEHKAIYDAFKTNDIEAGTRAMIVHMDNSLARKFK
ncbi:MAG: GntR family transcriptional regulator [Anaerovoracaceae bacterium]